MRSAPSPFFAAALSAAVLLVPAALSAQAGTVSGTVAHAETGEALSGVEVTITGTDLGSLSREDGTFTLGDVPAGRHTLRASRVGYNSAEREIRVSAGRTVRVQIELSEQAVELSGINVVGQVADVVAEEAVTATKAEIPRTEVPQSVSVITGEQLELQDAERLSEALRYTPSAQGEVFGFEPRTTFLRFRGFDATTTGLYRDGLQLRNPAFAISYDPEPYGARSVEVPRGPTSVLYGAGNPGGLVNFVSKRPTREPHREVGVDVGSFERIEGKLDLSGPVDEDGEFAYRLTGLVRESETQVDFIGHDRIFVAPALSWRPTGSTSFTVLGRYQRDETRSSQRLPAEGTLFGNTVGEIPVETFTGEPAVDEYDRDQHSVTTIFEHETDGIFSFRQKTRFYSVDLDNVGIFTAGLREDDRTIDRSLFESFGELDGVVLDNQIRARFGTGPAAHDLLLGVDYQHVDVALEENSGAAPPLDLFDPDFGQQVPEPAPFVDSDTEQEQVGVYLQEHLTLFENWILALNGRVDFADTRTEDQVAGTVTEQDEEELTGRAGLVYRSEIGLAPYVSVSESFLPSIGTDEDGESFEPERGEQVEVGAKYQLPGTNSFVSVAWFDLTRENFLQTDPETFRQVQSGEANSTGLEVEGQARLENGLGVIASYTHQEVEITESVLPAEVGDRPMHVPEDMASLWLDYRVQAGPLAGLGVGGGVRYLGSRFGDTPNTLEVPDNTLLDAMARYRVGDFELQLNVHNVLDDHYVATAFASGPEAFATYGPERSLRGSVAYRW
ncbi:MAG: TonB-dependent siderophore receptor [Gemmatimonadota bacterium]